MAKEAKKETTGQQNRKDQETHQEGYMGRREDETQPKPEEETMGEADTRM